jgi:hypothetical protein
MKKIFKTLLITFTLSAIVVCQDKVGTTIFRWAEIETGARAIGMGGSQVASGNGVYSIPYNPANLGFVENTELYISTSQYLAGTSHNTLAFGQSFNGSDFIGVHLYYFNSGEMDETIEQANDGQGGPTGEQFNYLGLVLRTSYARQITERLKLGGTFKLIRESTGKDLSMSSYGFDIGSNFDTGIYGMILGMCISNFGPEGRYSGNGLDTEDGTQKETGYYPMPITFRVGIMNNLIGPEGTVLSNGTHSLIFSMDVINPLDYKLTSSLGLEYSWGGMAHLRFGSHLGHDTAGITFGAGVEFKGFVLDYAWSDHNILLTTQQISLSYKF